MRLTLVSDAWHPQVNGVVRTLDHTVSEMRQSGHIVCILHPGLFRSIPMPGYPEIRVAWDVWRLGGMIERSQPDALHIAVEGSLGAAAKLWADRRGLRYTTSYHTRFPEYVAARIGVGEDLSYAALRWFHRSSRAVMINTASMRALLHAHGINNLADWGRGVDTTLFSPKGTVEPAMRDLARPILLNVGRVSIEKNLPAFYEAASTGTKVQIGDGPMLDDYRQRYPDVVFLGRREGEWLAACYRTADLFVFPSISDTFGLVILEAVASGLPVAAYPVTGPKDILTEGADGAMDDRLEDAIERALRLHDPDRLRTLAARWSWAASTAQFQSNLVSLHPNGELTRRWCAAR